VWAKYDIIPFIYCLSLAKAIRDLLHLPLGLIDFPFGLDVILNSRSVREIKATGEDL